MMIFSKHIRYFPSIYDVTTKDLCKLEVLDDDFEANVAYSLLVELNCCSLLLYWGLKLGSSIILMNQVSYLYLIDKNPFLPKLIGLLFLLEEAVDVSFFRKQSLHFVKVKVKKMVRHVFICTNSYKFFFFFLLKKNQNKTLLSFILKHLEGR
jgi:hypothetical protein